jgi:type IX secretion system PorP/SprF family membrane protein
MNYFKRIDRKLLGIVLLWMLCVFSAAAQQMPYYTQYKPNQVMINPAVLGTKRLLDIRTHYRMQWVGFEDSPRTATFNINGRVFKERIGVGLNYFSDVTGPTKRSDLSVGGAYHLTFDDVELSVGAAYHRIMYQVDGTKLRMQIPFDNSINLNVLQKKNENDLSAGIYFYNDRFHVGAAALNLAGASFNYFPKEDTVHKSSIELVQHIYGSAGYNWSGNPDVVWENSIQAMYAKSSPITIDYNIRMHYQQKMVMGLSFRSGDAIALNIGATFMDEFHISYSYDLVISHLKKFQSGSHEIMLAWSKNAGGDKRKKYNNSRFARQKYQFMF